MTTGYNQDFYFIGGLGIVNIEDTYGTANIGIGTKYWFTDALGIYLSNVAKFAMSNEELNSNYFQISLGLTYKFSKR